MLLLPTGMVAPTQRTIPDFVLERPVTAAEAVAAGATRGAVYAQGCSDLFAQFREGLDCRTLVSLERVPELGSVEWDGSTLEIGAAVDHHAGSHDARVRAALPGLAAGWGSIATQRIRRRATLGGNLMARRTRYEMSVMLGALDAELDFLTLDGTVTVSPAALWDRAEPPGGLLRAVRITDVRQVWFGYERSMRPLMTVAAAVRVGTVTMAVGSEYTRPYTVGAPLGTDPTEIAAALPEAIGDAAGSARYRRHVAAVLLGRLLERRTTGEGTPR
ncbi:FAD binding domain-containing protein [Streptomyces sp. NBC_00154]|uniref:FAD binding domain-containing protein n=1 Tax=Streptomyces sp. NBC_00154 TaxID=2975670 RepID=UPI002254DC86|nr:FAD binding domain-containing protein [Streptomyces sp. NBC_00154]MCX5310282.1 FAD binding domain-containing protein [Streptomyces sp. NBC_00154]